MKRLISLLIAILMAAAPSMLFTSCGMGTVPETPEENSTETEMCDTGIEKIYAVDLMDGIAADGISETIDPWIYSDQVTDFSARLFKECTVEGKNHLISPLSVFCSLSMLAGGAEGETLAEIEATLGMARGELNEFARAYMNILSNSDDVPMNMANSVWFKDTQGFTIDEDFLQTNANYFSADIYKAPFDKTTLNDINSWVKKKTDGMIEQIIDEIPYSAVVYLLNAISFDGKWENSYSESSIRKQLFFNEDGSSKNISFLSSVENIYLENEIATGFMKYYSGGNYALVALLPNEGVSTDEFIVTLDGDAITSLLDTSKKAEVKTLMPKFKVEFEIELKDALLSMGITRVFDEKMADLSSMAKSDAGLSTSRIFHKTFIEVNEVGTKAAAVTLTENTKSASSAETPKDKKEVILDRPFVYMIIDTATKIPVFMGTVRNID